jgi:nucleoside triphosphatase
MKTKICVGPILYDENNKIFLMESPKWNSWVVPGGKVEEGESEEEALRREMREELGIEITDIVKVGEKIKKPSGDFKDSEMTFIFKDYFAKACSSEVTPNEEISNYGWFSVEEALNLNLLDTTRKFVEQFRDEFPYN